MSSFPTQTVSGESAAAAAELLGRGEVVALPTETVYGLAADATRPEAVLKIFEAKERPFFDPLIVHLPDLGWLDRITQDRPGLVERLVERFWPGPLTLVLPRREIVPDLVTSGLSTVAVRMSAHPVFRSVASIFGKPIAAPSANRFGRISPTCARDVQSELGGRIPMIVDGGPTRHGLESTIIAFEAGQIRILRSGPITPEDLGEFAEVGFGFAGPKPEAPGQLKSHYAPRTPFRLLLPNHSPQNAASARIGFLGWKSAPEGFAATQVLSASGDLREAAATLFAKMRQLDEMGVDQIVAEPVPEIGLGIAIMDRLRKAAAQG
jgi:L-threonylcarbamoyladenylate synthase